MSSAAAAASSGGGGSGGGGGAKERSERIIEREGKPNGNLNNTVVLPIKFKLKHYSALLLYVHPTATRGGVPVSIMAAIPHDEAKKKMKLYSPTEALNIQLVRDADNRDLHDKWYAWKHIPAPGKEEVSLATVLSTYCIVDDFIEIRKFLDARSIEVDKLAQDIEKYTNVGNHSKLIDLLFKNNETLKAEAIKRAESIDISRLYGLDPEAFSDMQQTIERTIFSSQPSTRKTRSASKASHEKNNSLSSGPGPVSTPIPADVKKRPRKKITTSSDELPPLGTDEPGAETGTNPSPPPPLTTPLLPPPLPTPLSPPPPSIKTAAPIAGPAPEYIDLTSPRSSPFTPSSQPLPAIGTAPTATASAATTTPVAQDKDVSPPRKKVKRDDRGDASAVGSSTGSSLGTGSTGCTGSTLGTGTDNKQVDPSADGESSNASECENDGDGDGDVDWDEFTEYEDFPRQYYSSRKGHKKFRDKLLRRDGKKCVITGCSVEKCLQAAHIVPYDPDQEKRNSDVNNGLLLELRVHSLWDAKLIVFEPVWGSNKFRVDVTSPLLTDTEQLDAHTKSLIDSISGKEFAAPGGPKMMNYLKARKTFIPKGRGKAKSVKPGIEVAARGGGGGGGGD